MENQSLLQLSNQLEALRSDVRAMHNDVDQMHNALDAGRKQQRDYYADLDQRIRTWNRAVAVLPPGPPRRAARLPPQRPSRPRRAPSRRARAGDDKAAYQAAFNLLKDGHHDHAITAFQNFCPPIR